MFFCAFVPICASLAPCDGVQSKIRATARNGILSRVVAIGVELPPQYEYSS